MQSRREEIGEVWGKNWLVQVVMENSKQFEQNRRSREVDFSAIFLVLSSRW